MNVAVTSLKSYSPSFLGVAPMVFNSLPTWTNPFSGSSYQQRLGKVFAPFSQERRTTVWTPPPQNFSHQISGNTVDVTHLPQIQPPWGFQPAMTLSQPVHFLTAVRKGERDALDQAPLTPLPRFAGARRFFHTSLRNYGEVGKLARAGDVRSAEWLGREAKTQLSKLYSLQSEVVHFLAEDFSERLRVVIEGGEPSPSLEAEVEESFRGFEAGLRKLSDILGAKGLWQEPAEANGSTFVEQYNRLLGDLPALLARKIFQLIDQILLPSPSTHSRFFVEVVDQQFRQKPVGEAEKRRRDELAQRISHVTRTDIPLVGDLIKNREEFFRSLLFTYRLTHLLPGDEPQAMINEAARRGVNFHFVRAALSQDGAVLGDHEGKKGPILEYLGMHFERLGDPTGADPFYRTALRVYHSLGNGAEVGLERASRALARVISPPRPDVVIRSGRQLLKELNERGLALYQIKGDGRLILVSLARLARESVSYLWNVVSGLESLDRSGAGKAQSGLVYYDTDFDALHLDGGLDLRHATRVAGPFIKHVHDGSIQNGHPSLVLHTRGGATDGTVFMQRFVEQILAHREKLVQLKASLRTLTKEDLKKRLQDGVGRFAVVLRDERLLFFIAQEDSLLDRQIGQGVYDFVLRGRIVIGLEEKGVLTCYVIPGVFTSPATKPGVDMWQVLEGMNLSFHGVRFVLQNPPERN